MSTKSEDSGLNLFNTKRSTPTRKLDPTVVETELRLRMPQLRDTLEKLKEVRIVSQEVLKKEVSI